MNSVLWHGTVRHRRREPPAGAFAVRLFLLGLDLDELDSVFAGRWLWSARAPAPAWFRRADYLGDPAVPLKQAVLDRVERELGQRPAGPVHLVTHARYLGFVFNPVSFYFCHGGDGAVEAIVAEITNTPWLERHAYVLAVPPGRGAPLRLRARFKKSFHVSPFLAMDYDYDWSFRRSADTLVVHMENRRAGECRFDATLVLRRRPLDGRNLAGALLRHPCMTGTVAAAIYWQALKLWLRRAPFFAHPGRAASR